MQNQKGRDMANPVRLIPRLLCLMLCGLISSCTTRPEISGSTAGKPHAKVPDIHVLQSISTRSDFKNVFGDQSVWPCLGSVEHSVGHGRVSVTVPPEPGGLFNPEQQTIWAVASKFANDGSLLRYAVVPLKFEIFTLDSFCR